MGVYCNGTAVIEHSTTGTRYDIKGELLDWIVADEDDGRGMGTETHYQAKLEHPNLGILSWDIWEYPVGTENAREQDMNGHKAVVGFLWGIDDRS